MDFKDMTISAFAQGIADDPPLAGGGCVSALAGSYGAALVAMVARKTISNKKYADLADQFQAILGECAPLLAQLLDAIQGDHAAFAKVKLALAMPKGNAEEAEKRMAMMQEGLKAAAQAPLAVAECCAKLLPLCREALERGNKNAASDALVGVLMVRSAILGSVYNIRINLASIHDQAFCAKMEQRADQLEQLALEEEQRLLALSPTLTKRN